MNAHGAVTYSSAQTHPGHFVDGRDRFQGNRAQRRRLADAARRLAADNELMPITKVAKMA